MVSPTFFKKIKYKTDGFVWPKWVVRLDYFTLLTKYHTHILSKDPTEGYSQNQATLKLNY